MAAMNDPAAENHIAQEHANAINLEVFKAVFAMTKLAINSLILINGGAVVALLALIGHIVSTPGKHEAIPSFARPLFLFVFGVWAAVCLAAFVALSQKLHAEALKRAHPTRTLWANVS
jgi:hypothetical protein